MRKQEEEFAKHLANAGCSKCLCCGEEKGRNEYLREGITNKGIFVSWPILTVTPRLFRHTKHEETIMYRCYTCGASWESEPYEVAYSD